MHRLDARDVEPASRRRRDERDRLSGELPREHDLLQVAARQLPGRNIRARRPIRRKRSMTRSASSRMRAHAQHGAERHLRLAVRLQHDVRGNAQTRRDAGAEAVFGNVGDTGADRGARIAVANTSPRDAHLPGGRRTHPDDRLPQARADRCPRRRRRPRSPRRTRSATTSRSAATPRSPSAHTSSSSSTASPGSLTPSRRRPAFDLVPHHQRGQRTRRGVGGRHRGHRLSAPKNRDPVGDGLHLVQLVRDEDDRPSVRSHRANRLEQCARFLWSQHRSGLVEDQDACILVQRFQDLDALLLSDGELPDRARGATARP